MALQQFTFNGKPYQFSNVTTDLAKALQTVPRIIGQEGVNFFRERFREQGWRDKGLTKWSQRSKNDKKPGRGILIRSGRMMRSIYNPVASWRQVVISAPVPYAIAHNEGFNGTVTVRQHTRRTYTTVRHGRGIYSIKTKKELTTKMKQVNASYTVRSHTRKMNLPQRQYMGNSEALNKIIDGVLTKYVNPVF